jgi:hypothetical protein
MEHDQVCTTIINPSTLVYKATSRKEQLQRRKQESRIAVRV